MEFAVTLFFLTKIYAKLLKGKELKLYEEFSIYVITSVIWYLGLWILFGYLNVLYILIEIAIEFFTLIIEGITNHYLS